MVVPIIIPMGGGGGSYTLGELCVLLPITIMALMWVVQVVFATINLFDPMLFRSYRNIREYLYWLIPVYPLVCAFINKLKLIGKTNDNRSEIDIYV